MDSNSNEMSSNNLTIIEKSTTTTKHHTRTPSTKPQYSRIPCCLCGRLIDPNPANQCTTCLASQFDLQPALRAGGDVYQCRRCLRYETVSGKRYEALEPESHGLLKLCLSKIPALSNHSLSAVKAGHSNALGSTTGVDDVQLVDASWIWTEPHSMRFKVRLTVRASVLDQTLLIQQRVFSEFVIRWKQCKDCGKEFTNQTWQAIVQLRQKRHDETHKGLLVLEMAIAKAENARKHVIDIKTMRHGFDFYFGDQMKAQNFAQFLSRFAPMKIKTTTKLVSTDNHSNTANIKATIICDMVPLARDDLVIADKRAKDGFKLSGRLVLVQKVSSTVHLIDASPARNLSIEDAAADLTQEKYWKSEKFYRILLDSKRLIRFVVMDVELCDGRSEYEREIYKGPKSNISKYALADVEVMRECDFGVTEESFHVVTHLGHLLSVGDVCIGYDLTTSVNMDVHDEVAFNSSYNLPEIVLVKKVQGVDSKKSAKPAESNAVNKNLKGTKKKHIKKRIERKRAKEEKKQAALLETAVRMGFVENDEDFGDDINLEKNDFELELERDPELLAELEATQELMSSMHMKNDADDDSADR